MAYTIPGYVGMPYFYRRLLELSFLATSDGIPHIADEDGDSVEYRFRYWSDAAFAIDSEGPTSEDREHKMSSEEWDQYTGQKDVLVDRDVKALVEEHKRAQEAPSARVWAQSPGVRRKYSGEPCYTSRAGTYGGEPLTPEHTAWIRKQILGE